MTYDQVRTAHTWNLCSAFNLSKVHTHTAVNTDTHHEHTPRAVGSLLCCDAWGAVGGSVPCSRAWYWGWRECWILIFPTYNSCWLETQTCNLSITSPTLTILPRLPIDGISTILYNLSYRNTNIPYILPKIIEGNYLKAHKWTALQRFSFLFWQIKKKTFFFFIFVQWKSCSLVFLLFFSFWLSFFVFFIVPSPICFSFWSASLFQNFIYIYCTETLWLTSLNLYCGAWIEDIWNVTLTSDLHLLYPQLLARSLNPESFISILFHCVLLCTCAHFFTSSSPTAHVNPWFRV